MIFQFYSRSTPPPTGPPQRSQSRTPKKPTCQSPIPAILHTSATSKGQTPKSSDWRILRKKNNFKKAPPPPTHTHSPEKRKHVGLASRLFLSFPPASCRVAHRNNPRRRIHPRVGTESGGREAVQVAAQPRSLKSIGKEFQLLGRQFSRPRTSKQEPFFFSVPLFKGSCCLFMRADRGRGGEDDGTWVSVGWKCRWCDLFSYISFIVALAHTHNPPGMLLRHPSPRPPHHTPSIPASARLGVPSPLSSPLLSRRVSPSVP